jgi:hypothetical protein
LNRTDFVHGQFGENLTIEGCTRFFQTAVCTMRPLHSISRGSPMFTDSNRAMCRFALIKGPEAT